jgi:hypothetical protein
LRKKNLLITQKKKRWAFEWAEEEFAVLMRKLKSFGGVDV